MRANQARKESICQDLRMSISLPDIEKKVSAKISECPFPLSDIEMHDTHLSPEWTEKNS